MTTTATKVIGAAVYFEVTRTSGAIRYTTQTLVTPEFTAPGGRVVAPMMYRRRISTQAPKRTWRPFTNHMTSEAALTHLAGNIADEATQQRVADAMLSSFESSLLSMAERTITGDRFYELVGGRPIVVEVTSDDLADLQASRTPYKVFGRVWKARKALGFPEGFLD